MYNRGLAIGVKNLQKGAGKAKARATIFSRSQAVTRLLPLRDLSLIHISEPTRP